MLKNNIPIAYKLVPVGSILHTYGNLSLIRCKNDSSW